MLVRAPPVGRRPVSSRRIDPSLLVAGVAALGLLLVVIRWVSFPRYNGGGLSYDVGARYGIYLALIAGIAAVTAAVLAMRALRTNRLHRGLRRSTMLDRARSRRPEAPATPEE